MFILPWKLLADALERAIAGADKDRVPIGIARELKQHLQ